MREEPTPEGWPRPPEGLTEKLRHVLDLFEAYDDSTRMVSATHGIYGHGAWTGLTLGDLREALTRIEEKKL